MNIAYTIKNIPDKDFYYTTNFDIEIAKYLLEFSALSYNKDENSILEELKKFNNFKLIKIFQKDNAKALIFFNEVKNIIVVSFTGTEKDDLNDFITDTKFWNTKTQELKGKVHFGFYEYYKKLKICVLKEILKLDKNKDKNIYWTGHSLGGAVAVLFSAVYNKGVVYTFGQPKIGNKIFAKYCNKNITLYRIRTFLDIIPLLPPSIIFYYKHSNEEYTFYYNLENLKLKNKLFYNNIIFKIFITLFYNFFLFQKKIKKNLLFHSLNAYRKILYKENYHIKFKKY